MSYEEEKNNINLDLNNTHVWHPQHEVILKQWGEIAASYRWLHNEAYKKFRKQNISFTLPVIILSTIAGTANFSQGSLSGNYAIYAPLIIGFLNLLAGLLTTIAEFLKVSELTENHRSNSLCFGKLSRNIKVELSLPYAERTVNGRDFVNRCRGDMDRLLEQSAGIPNEILNKYEKKFGNAGIYTPEILDVHKVDIYQDDNEIKEKKIGGIIANAAQHFSSYKNNSSK